MQKVLKISVVPSEEKSKTNRIYFNQRDFPDFGKCYIKIDSRVPYIYFAQAAPEIAQGTIALNKIQRIGGKASKGKAFACSIYEPPSTGFHLQTLSLHLRYKNERGYTPEVDGEEILEEIKRIMDKHVVTMKQEFGFFYLEKLVIAQIHDFKLFDLSDITNEGLKGGRRKKRESGERVGMIIKDTKIMLKSAPKSRLKLTNVPQIAAEGLFKGGKASFKEMGIGGLDEQLQTIFRRAFASRIYPKEVINKFGIQHVKGILLWGPPGTGKTLIARQIGKVLNTKEPKIINGPEVLNKFVGESEANIRNLFTEAEAEYTEKGDDSELHLIIFDEIDAICKSRGTTRSGTGVNDSVVNQLLSKIDGVNALNNVLIIGMTNRIDLIDEALLRSGRFEIKVEIGLPGEEGRVDIFEIHTRDMVKNNVLGDDVSLEKLAKMTNNYSGAEIAGVVRSAVAFALNKHINFDDLDKTMQNLPKLAGNVKVKMRDFERGVKEVKPSYGVSEDALKPILAQPLISYGPRFERLKKSILEMMEQLRGNTRNSLLSVLLEGASGCGKTSLAVHLACRESGYPFVKMISPQDMIGFMERSKCTEIVKIFEEAYKSPLSLIILDNLERMIEYIEMGPKFSNVVLQALMVIVKKLPPRGRRLLIVGTTANKEALAEVNLTSVFDYVFHIPQLNRGRKEEIMKVLKSAADFKEGAFEEIIGSLPEYISIKQLLLIVEMAQSKVRKKGGFVTAEAFLEALSDCGFYK